jgi:hypothetical protein
MSLSNFDQDMNIIAALSDDPNADDGLTAAQLKAKFDSAGNKIKTWFNSVLIPYINGANIGSDNIKTGAVTSAKLADYAVVSGKIADYAVTSNKIANEAVTGDRIADATIGSSKLADGAITPQKLSFSIKENYFANYGITTAAELDAAWNAGKFPVCVHSLASSAKIITTVYPMVHRETAQNAKTKYVFSMTYGGYINALTLEDDVWSQSHTPI